MKDLFRRLRGADPYPTSVELPESSDDLREVVRARIEAGRRPDLTPQAGRGPLLAAATAVVVIVVGVGAFLFTRSDDSAPVATSPTTVPGTTVPGTTVPETTAPSTTSSATTATTTTIGSALRACTESAPEADNFLAFFADCSVGATAPYPVYRATDDDRTELALLLLGTTEREKARQLATGWDFLPAADRERLTVDAVLDSDDVLTLEFLLDGETWTPGSLASSSAQLLSFLEPLQATVFATSPGVAAIDLSNLCWGEMGCGPPGSNVITRATWEGGLFVNYGVIPTDGCGLVESFSSLECLAFNAPVKYDATVVGVAADDTLNVRSGPGAEYFVVTEVAPGDVVVALDYVATAADGGQWQLINAPDTTPGWVNTAFIAPTSDEPEPLPDLEHVVVRYVDYANGEPEAFADLRLGASVDLGLGTTIYLSRPGEVLSEHSGMWVIEERFYEGFEGPFTPLGRLASIGEYEVTIGEHPHCAGSPRPAPDGYETHTRVSIQPVLGEQSSCIEWFTVDWFFNEERLVEAITLDFFGP